MAGVTMGTEGAEDEERLPVCRAALRAPAPQLSLATRAPEDNEIITQFHSEEQFAF